MLSLVALTSLGMLATQFLVFMRTDVYFLLQDLSGCRNMYGDASAYARHLALRLLRRPSPDPLTVLERRALRTYAVLLVAGTAACLGVAFAVTCRRRYAARPGRGRAGRPRGSALRAGRRGGAAVRGRVPGALGAGLVAQARPARATRPAPPERGTGRRSGLCVGAGRQLLDESGPLLGAHP